MNKKLFTLILIACISLSGCGGCNKTENTSSSSSVSETDLINNSAVNNVINVEDKDLYVSTVNYKGLTFKYPDAPTVEVTDTEINSVIQKKLEADANQIESNENIVRNGDRVYFSYTCDLPALDFAQENDNAFAIIGASEEESFYQIKGIDNVLLGKEKGVPFTAELTFPIDSTDKKIAGKTLVFNITIKSIYKTEVPKLTDELVTKLSSKSKTVAEYKEEIKSELKAERKSWYENKIVGFILSSFSIKKYPDGVNSALDKDMVKDDLFFGIIADKEHLTVTNDEHKVYLDEIISEHGFSSEDELLKLYSKDRVEKLILRKKVINFLMMSNTLADRDK